MRSIHIWACLLLISFATACSTTEKLKTESNAPAAYTKPERPTPYTLEVPKNIALAIENGTRTTTGEPGPNYWTQWGEYKIDAELIPADTLLKGVANITYYNQSPDALPVLIMELTQNIHEEGAIRKEPAEVTGGMKISSLKINGKELSFLQRLRPGMTGYAIRGTSLFLLPPSPINSGESVTLDIEYSFKIPQSGASGRMGYNGGNLFHIAYWYPHISVYDDVNKWFTDVFTGNAEFYFDYGNYELSITAPVGWVVDGTGSFLNPEETLAPIVLERYKNAINSDSITHIITEDDFGKATNSTENGKLTWKFSAKNVRDVVFTATKESNWDGTRTNVGDRDGDGNVDYARINSFWRNGATNWEHGAEFAQHSIWFMSKFTDFSYPWPHMTVVEGNGIVGGGMEFPMSTLIGAYNNAPANALYDVITHELAHMWMPMIVGSNERRRAWMDEGSTTFHEANARGDKYPGTFNNQKEFAGYLDIAGTPLEGEIMRWSDYQYPGPAYGVASYPKPASILIALRGLLGEDVFNEAWHTYIKRWAYKHPTPNDLFNTFENVSGKDLDWFWQSWYFETWVLDQAVTNVSQNDGEATIEITDLGKVVMPVVLTVTLEDGKVLDTTLSVDDWMMGKTKTEVTLATPSPVVKVVIDQENNFPDKNRDNNVWTK